MAGKATGRKAGGNGGRKRSAGSNSAPQKRYQRQRGHPDPDAKIIALTAKALMDGKCFSCKYCSKSFAREQNLILHSRRHHVPCELKKTSDGTPRKTAYVCPVATCRHHNPKRALSDITGIKKHFGRAHCMKLLACTRCDKKYAIKADLKAHVKIHHKDDLDAGAEISDAAFDQRYVRAEQVWGEDLEHLANASSDSDSGISENEEAADATAEADNNNDITHLSRGASEQQDVYVPLLNVAPVHEQREQVQAAADASVPLDLDLELLGSLPMGLTGLLTDCAPPGNSEAPVGAAANSFLDPSALFSPAASIPTTASACGLGGALPKVNVGLSFSPYGDQSNSDVVNHGAQTLESLSFPAYEVQYGKADTSASGHVHSAAELVQMADMIGRNTSVTSTPAVLSNAAAFQMPQLPMIPSMDNFYYPAGVLSQQTMRTPNPSFSFAPFFGDAALGNTHNHTMGGGSCDGFSGFFIGSADLNQGRDVGANGGFSLGLPPVCASQYQSPNLTDINLPASGLSYASILSRGACAYSAAAETARQMDQTWVDMQMQYAAPPPAAPELVNYQILGNGAGGHQGIDLFGPSGEGPSRWFEEQGRVATFDPTAGSSSGDLDASLRYGGLQGANPGFFW